MTFFLIVNNVVNFIIRGLETDNGESNLFKKTELCLKKRETLIENKERGLSSYCV